MAFNKPPIMPLRPGEVAMTGTPGASVAQRRLGTTVRPGKNAYVAQDGAVVPQGKTTPSGTRISPPLQPNATTPTVVSINSRSPNQSARVRNSNTTNRHPAISGAGTVSASRVTVSSLNNPLLGGQSPIGGYRQDAHAIPLVLQGTPVKA